MSYDNIRKELELQLERFIQLKDRLDNKANNMITMTGTIATLFMGFGIFLLSDVTISEKNVIFVTASAITLMMEVFFTILTIRYALNSYKLREYYHPFGYKKFMNNENFDLDKVKELRDMKNPDFDENIIYNYTESLKSYATQTKLQFEGINDAQKVFKIALYAIPVFTFLMILIKYIN